MKKIQEFLTKLFQSFFSFLKIIILSKYIVKLPREDPSKDCLILANGPSLNITLKEKMDFLLSGNKKIIVVNHFCSTEYFEKLKPSYYVIVAPQFFIENTSDSLKELRDKTYETILNKTSWPLILFLPQGARKTSVVKNRFDSNKNIKIVYFNSTPVEGFQSVSNLFFKLNLGMPRPHNVLIPSIFLALNMGFKKIYLFGADHSWHEIIKVNDNNEVSVNHQHFYENSPVVVPMLQLDGKPHFIHDVFRTLYLAFKGYFVLKAYSDSIGSKIYNASEKSYIDAFVRIKITD